MPEQLSKHPEVTMRVLEGAGARCGQGVKPQILTQCPRERFCALPTGEICVYGIEQIPQMTQITTEELAAVVCHPPGEAPAGAMAGVSIGLELPALLLAGLLAGLALGRRR